jgi:class 3 adenylate cyclase
MLPATAGLPLPTRSGRWRGCGRCAANLIDPTIAVHHGRVVKRTGDGSIVEFRSVVDAVRCAIEVKNGMLERNAGLSPDRRFEFRVGIHSGDVVEESDGDLSPTSVMQKLSST